MIDSNKDLVTSLESKIDLLVKRYKGLSEECNKLQEENQKLMDQLNRTSADLTEAQTKYNHLKLAKTVELSQGDGHDAKLKINQMVREIDKCIALLNR
jgi:chromosome segregation ATPase